MMKPPSTAPSSPRRACEEKFHFGHPSKRHPLLPDTLSFVTRRTMNSRTAGIMVAGVAAATLLTGCGEVINPYTTELHYDAADGVSASVGSLKAVNLLVVNNDKSSAGSVGGMVYNSSQSDESLTLSANGESQTIQVPAQESVRLDGKVSGNDPAKVSPVKLASLGNAKPGDTINVTLKSNGGSTQVQVPVLLNQSPYGTAAPSHAAN